MDWEKEAKEWEETAYQRMREINRLREIVRCSTRDSFIVEKAVSFYTESKKAFDASRSAKADDAPFNEGEIKRRAEVEAITQFIVNLEVMDYASFIEHAQSVGG
jgi:hypothetical protein